MSPSFHSLVCRSKVRGVDAIGEVGDRGARGREPQLGVAGQVADDGDDGLACHVCLPGSVSVSLVGQRASGRMTLVRSTDSFSVSWRSSSLTVAGSAWSETTA